MPRKFFCSIKEIVENGGLEKAGLVPQSVEEILSHIHRPGGFWHIIQRDKLTGEIEVEQLCENAYSDFGVSVMWNAICNSASSYTSTPGNIIAIDQSLGWTTTTASIASGGTVTSITVAAPTGPNIPSGTQLVINPGSNSLTVTLTQAINGAGTFTVTSTPGPTSTIASGASVRYSYIAVPTADPTSLSAPASYTSAMPSGQFGIHFRSSYSGYGNRLLTITNGSAYLFSTSGTPPATAGTYTNAWLTNTNPISANTQTFIRCAFDTALVIDSTHIGQININENL